MVSVSSNCSSRASWSRGLNNAKGTQIVRSVITLDRTLRPCYLHTYSLHYGSIGLRNRAFHFKMKISLCRLLQFKLYRP